MEIYERIKAIRESKGLSQADMAASLGIANQNYWKIEKGKTELTVARLRQIADVLGVTELQLLTGKTEIESEVDKTEKLERRIKELEKVIDLHETLQLKSKIYINILGETTLKSLLFVVETGQLLASIKKNNDKDDIELEVSRYNYEINRINIATGARLEYLVLNTKIFRGLETFSDVTLKILNLAEYHTGVFSEKIHEYLRKELESYRDVIAMNPDIFSVL